MQFLLPAEQHPTIASIHPTLNWPNVMHYMRYLQVLFPAFKSQLAKLKSNILGEKAYYAFSHRTYDETEKIFARRHSA